MTILAEQIVTAKIYLRLFNDLNASIQEFEREFHSANTFFGITIKALREAFWINLCRVYDGNKEVLSLHRVLKEIKNNPNFSEAAYFKECLKDKFYDETKAQTDIETFASELKQDLFLVSSNDNLVKKLANLRGSIFAHTNFDHFLNINNAIKTLGGLSCEECETLINRAHEIINKYATFYNAEVFDDKILCHDDYEKVLKALRFHSESQKEAWQLENVILKNLSQNMPPIHAGEILQAEYLTPHNLSANKLAAALSVPTNRITAILKGEEGITGDTALPRIFPPPRNFG